MEIGAQFGRVVCDRGAGVRNVFFLVADKNMEAMIKGFFSRTAFHRTLGCGPFVFEPHQDLLVAHGLNDPGLFTRANELLQPFVRTHAHAVVMLDSDWEGSPGADAIKKRIDAHLISAGWTGDTSCSVVIHPELESWVWQDSPHVHSVLGCKESYMELQKVLEAQGFWGAGASKPHRPKEAVEWVLRRAKISRSSAMYQQLSAVVTTKRCSDSSFLALTAALQRWFPSTLTG